MARLTYTLALALSITAVQAAVVEHWWNITYLEGNPNGVCTTGSGCGQTLTVCNSYLHGDSLESTEHGRE